MVHRHPFPGPGLGVRILGEIHKAHADLPRRADAIFVNSRNLLFSRGEINRDDLWPKITEYRDQPCTFRFSFGLDELPTEAGIILIRGPRQFGKSTWLELAIKRTLETHGAGSAYFLNGDDITDADELETRVLEVVSLFRPKAAVQRRLSMRYRLCQIGSGR
jgi:hypothetical protein